MSAHNAPPVVYPLRRPRFQGLILLGLWLSGLLFVLLWIYTTQQVDWRKVLALVAVLAVGLAAYTRSKTLRPGQLAWDGETWRLETLSYQTGSAEFALSVIADFQQSLLLKLQNQAHASIWIWAERSSAPERWLDLRRAVYSPHRSAAVPLPYNPVNVDTPPAVAVSVSIHSVDAAQTNS